MEAETPLPPRGGAVGRALMPLTARGRLLLLSASSDSGDESALDLFVSSHRGPGTLRAAGVRSGVGDTASDHERVTDAVSSSLAAVIDLIDGYMHRVLKGKKIR
ncbi:hypothetical protein AB0C02_32615 [Micromonospora sp. NPDC048999]|uniref:hypothetical protein n=1 Tax=Micromonospora sp. NPDC048999 TaxID=3155391 RepID=UPI0033C77260